MERGRGEFISLLNALSPSSASNFSSSYQCIIAHRGHENWENDNQR